jgi:DNA-binding response OmpR family regulator
MKTTILVVDDETELRDLVAQVLTRSGFKVITASNGQEALEIASASHVDMVFTDYDMPVMNGEQLVQALHEQGRTVPTIVNSGLMDDARHMRLSGYGAQTLSKPYNFGTLVSMINARLSERALPA